MMMKNTTKSKRFYLLSLVLFVFITILIVSSCKKEGDVFMVQGPGPQPAMIAEKYHYRNGDDSLAALGRVLFYDRNLSLNNAISCGSCHKQEKAFADNHRFSLGLNNQYSTRNTSAIISSFGHAKFWDGRASNFDTAVFMPVLNHAEMNMFDLGVLAEKLSHLPYYAPLFEDAFGTPDVTVLRIRKALAAFVSNLYSHDSRYDRQLWRFIPGTNNPPDLFDANETLGQSVFFGKGKCYVCHSGQDFNNYQTMYANIGLDVNYDDKGRANISKNAEDQGKFLVPTLRNIALTAPYMHDGRFKTLAEVIDHYSDGIQDSKNLSWVFREGAPFQQNDFFFFNDVMVQNQVFNPSILTPLPPQGGVKPVDISQFPARGMHLTKEEKKALEAFLNTLTDPMFITDPKFSNPFR